MPGEASRTSLARIALDAYLRAERVTRRGVDGAPTCEIVDLIPLYAPDAAVQQKLLIGNPARLFKFT